MSEEMPDAPVVPDHGMPPHAPIERSAREELTEPARMSPFARLANIFFSPGEVFEDVRRSPRDWWLPMIVFVLVAIGAGYVVQHRLELTPDVLGKATTDMGLDQQGKTRKDVPAEQAATMDKVNTVIYEFLPVIVIVLVPLGFAVIAGIFRLIMLIAQAQTTYFRVLSVVAYSYYVPNVIKSLLAVVLAFLKQPGDIDALTFIKSGGILAAGPAALVSVAEHPVLRTFLSFFDVFSIWWIVLVAIGLAAVSRKLKMGTAAAIVVTPYVLLMVLSVLFALVTAK